MWDSSTFEKEIEFVIERHSTLKYCKKNISVCLIDARDIKKRTFESTNPVFTNLKCCKVVFLVEIKYYYNVIFCIF